MPVSRVGWRRHGQARADGTNVKSAADAVTATA